MIATQPASEVVVGLLEEDAALVAWWVTWVECAVALNRLVREGILDEEAVTETRALLDRLSEEWSVVQPINRVRILAESLSRRHPLRAADALQLAAALVWCEEETEGRGFVCLDERLRQAASHEGFAVLPEEDAA